MISKAERAEILSDANSKERMMAFSYAKNYEADNSVFSIDDLCDFLRDFQNIFSEFDVSKHRTNCSHNKL